MAILGPDGRPIETGRLKEQVLMPSLTGVRSILSDHPARGLSPSRLVQILDAAEGGDPVAYLELAEDMEERDLHYLSVLGTRKRAVSQQEWIVEAASDAAADVKAADFVRDFLRGLDTAEAVFDGLDAVGKGFSGQEILWDMSGREWRPVEIVYGDPRWFRFDETGRQLRLYDPSAIHGLDLPPGKFITHTHKAKSGVPIRGGLARIAAWSYLFKVFALKDWVGFLELYGQPLRLGWYHQGATEGQINVLRQAVAGMGTNAAAVVPEGMRIELLKAQGAGGGSGADLYKSMCDWLDRQVSKGVLGQTLTSDVGDSGSRALGDVHNDVRDDIRRADARQIERTFNRDLIVPAVRLNFGDGVGMPIIRIGLPDELSTLQKVKAFVDLAPYGLTAGASTMRDMLGIPDPADDEDLLQQKATPAPILPPPSDGQTDVSANAQTPPAAPVEPDEGDLIERAAAAALDDGWEEMMTPIIDPLADLVDRAQSLEEVQAGLADLVGKMDVSKLGETLARLGFAAQLSGFAKVPLDDN